ncbi:hypothetical protein PMAYCL1PPCAC_21042 [Pristionchus mayeri]|uniref:Signal peptide peptidase n=1 Tax=Pristionchus mayeri TaxID=1317129 RepID=A0AAN5I3M9_9BILA|nr:hypothetical protein PMAYCL1PPCAC_21042 [Pristionchus mayeri]
MNPLLGRVAASMCILTMAAIVIQIACLRSSTIYFFELDTTTVLFVSKRHALAFPMGLSALLAAVYFATKRMKIAEMKRNEEEAMRRAQDSKSPSVSRKVSRTADLRPIFEMPSQHEEAVRSAERLKRMLSDIEEHQNDELTPIPTSAAGTINEAYEFDHASEEYTPEEIDINIAEHDDSPRCSADRGSEDSVSPGEPFDCDSPLPVTSTLVQAEEFSQPGSRKSSIGSRTGLLSLSRRGSVSVADEVRPCDLYKELGQIDMLTYLVNAMNVLPIDKTPGTAMKKSVRLSDIIADVIAVHLPVWACVAALHVVLLEIIATKFAFYFYYHEETMAYAALFSSIIFGLIHEFAGGWLSTDILALASVYVVVSRIQLVSFQTGVVLSVGLIVFDLFWIYVVDLLSTVTKESRAPLMILVPRDNDGGKQSLATLDVMAPGVFLNLLLKFNAMYDPKTYAACWYAGIGGLGLTLATAVWRRKITPALVLPLISIMLTSLIVVDRPHDLWRFAIKH